MTGLTDREAIRELKYEYCYRLDALDEEGFIELFTRDAAFDIAGISAGEGHAALREFLGRIESQGFGFLAHMVANPVVRVDEATGTGRWYYVVMYETRDGGVEWGQGRYDDEYRRVDGTWKIAATTAERRHTVHPA